MTISLPRNHQQVLDDGRADAVLEEIRHLATLDDALVLVSVAGDAATLYGRVHSRAQAVAAQRAALHVDGIRAVASEMVVTEVDHPTNTDIAAMAAAALEMDPHIPDTVLVSVYHRVLTVAGEVVWPYQRDAACRAVKKVDGNDTVVDAIIIVWPVVAAQLEARIVVELLRSGSGPDDRVVLHGNSLGTLTITGSVSSQEAARRAEQLCQEVPGVTSIVNLLTVPALL